MNLKQIRSSYCQHGFAKFTGFAGDKEIAQLTETLMRFHRNWCVANLELYQQGAVNSAYLTGTQHLTSTERSVLFDFIGSHKVMELVQALPLLKPAFMNTQLFFAPVNCAQSNYWHRDPQYHLNLQQQRQALSGPEVIHLRLALKDEPGIELVPGSHRNWDSDEELAVRQQMGGRSNSEPLSTGLSLPLQRGDLLIFSANMIHRGLYGNQRLGFDMLFCEALPELLKFADANCLPSDAQLQQLQAPMAFLNTLNVKGRGDCKSD